MKSKNYLALFVLLIFGLIGSTTIFPQDIKTVDKISPVAVNKLSKELLPVSSDLSLSPASFFTYSVDSISQITIQLFDENKIPLSKVIIAENTLDKSVEYKISSSATDVEWVKITRSSSKNRNATQAISSSGKTLKIITSTEKSGKCINKSQISEIEIFSDTILLKKLSKDQLQTKESQENMKFILMEAEATIYDTYKLGLLQKVILALDNLHKTLLENSTPPNKLNKPNRSEPPSEEALPHGGCNIFCVRIGTLIPVYLCNDFTLNCGSCGVNGVYLLSGYGCNIICSIPCSVFWT